jgi:hypothetical protein
MTRALSSRITKATNTYSKYVTIIAFLVKNRYPEMQQRYFICKLPLLLKYVAFTNLKLIRLNCSLHHHPVMRFVLEKVSQKMGNES